MDRLLSATRGAATASFVYDDTGARVIATEGVTTTVYVGSYFEWRGTITDTVKYYYANTVRVAMRKGEGPALFLLGDHLGSTNRLFHADGTPVTPGGMRLYKAWGEPRYEPYGELVPEYRYTGQFEDGYIGLYWYGARWYDSYITQFSQPDTIVPDLYNPLDWNRYAYARYSPVKYSDPTGHMVACPDCGGGGPYTDQQKLEKLRELRETDRADNFPADPKLGGNVNSTSDSGGMPDRSMGGLIAAGVVLTLGVFTSEVLLIWAEVAIAPVAVGAPMIGVPMEAILIGSSVVLMDIEIAYWAYVYEIYQDPTGQDELELLPPWGLND